jgi:nucleoid-associated protein YejK
MVIDLSNIQIEKIIIHEVIKQPKSNTKIPPIYSEIESSLDDELRLFMKDRIVKSLSGKKSYQIIFDDKQKSPIPQLFDTWIKKPASFVSISKEAATHLNNIQNGRNPGGLVAVIEVKHQNRFCLAILKLEKEEGARLEQTSFKGKNTFDILHIRDLILSEKTQLFKIAIFFQNGLKDLGYDGKLCDNQLNANQHHDVADFFLRNYLGCTHIGDPRELTKVFFYETQNFINSKISDPLERSKTGLHLLSYLSKPLGDINATQFARDFLSEHDKQDYITFLSDNGVLINSFPKDNTMIKNKLNDLCIEFENGVKVIGKQDKFDANVSLSDAGEGKTKAEIIGKLKKVK